MGEGGQGVCEFPVPRSAPCCVGAVTATGFKQSCENQLKRCAHDDRELKVFTDLNGFRATRTTLRIVSRRATGGIDLTPQKPASMAPEHKLS